MCHQPLCWWHVKSSYKLIRTSYLPVLLEVQYLPFLPYLPYLLCLLYLPFLPVYNVILMNVHILADTTHSIVSILLQKAYSTDSELSRGICQCNMECSTLIVHKFYMGSFQSQLCSLDFLFSHSRWFMVYSYSTQVAVLWSTQNLEQLYFWHKTRS